MGSYMAGIYLLVHFGINWFVYFTMDPRRLGSHFFWVAPWILRNGKRIWRWTILHWMVGLAFRLCWKSPLCCWSKWRFSSIKLGLYRILCYHSLPSFMVSYELSCSIYYSYGFYAWIGFCNWLKVICWYRNRTKKRKQTIKRPITRLCRILSGICNALVWFHLPIR